MSCTGSETLIHTYVDGELTGPDRQVFEKHISDCGVCGKAVRLQARFKAAVRGHLAPPSVPAEVRTRITTALFGAAVPARARWVSWRLLPKMAPAFAAAGIMVAVFVSAKNRVSPVIEQAVSTHNKEVPLDVVASDCSRVASWFRGKVDFNVQPPVLGKKSECEGGRLVNVSSDKYGAFVRYRAPNGGRLSVLMVDNKDKDDEPTSDSVRRRVKGHDVFFGSARGASTATFKGRGNLWYVVTSDLDEDGLSNVVEAAFQPGN